MRPIARHLARTLLILVACAGFAGCGLFQKPVDPGYTALAESSDESGTAGELGPGDIISIRVFGEEDLTGKFSVSKGGTINYPYIGRIDIEGMTCADVEDRVTTGLKDGYLKKPDVTCAIEEYNSKRIYVLGEVKEPGSYPYKATLTIVEAFALAGGATNRAATNGTKLTREMDGREVQVRVPMQEVVEGRQKNIRLQPGDVVYVPQSAY